MARFSLPMPSMLSSLPHWRPGQTPLFCPVTSSLNWNSTSPPLRAYRSLVFPVQQLSLAHAFSSHPARQAPPAPHPFAGDPRASCPLPGAASLKGLSLVTARISTASSAAFLPPFTATVATGTPEGICAVLSSASIPPSPPEATGTPITGSTVSAAAAPARCRHARDTDQRAIAALRSPAHEFLSASAAMGGTHLHGIGNRIVFEHLRGFPGDRLIAGAPHDHGDLLHEHFSFRRSRALTGAGRHATAPSNKQASKRNR